MNILFIYIHILPLLQNVRRTERFNDGCVMCVGALIVCCTMFVCVTLVGSGQIIGHIVRRDHVVIWARAFL